MCKQKRTRKHNRECVQRPEGCLTTSLVCLCLCVLRLLSSLSYLVHPLPHFCLSLSTGIVGKQVENYSERTDIVHSLCYVSEADQWAWVRRYAQLLGDNGESVDYCLCGNEVNLTFGRSCTVSPSGAHTQCLSSNCDLFSFRLIIAT